MNAFVRIVVIALLALVGYYVLLFLNQRQLLYPAPRGPVSTRLPSDVRRIELRDGDDIGYALYAAAGDSAGNRHPAIIFTHGNAERVEEWAGEFGALQRRGVAVLMPEFDNLDELKRYKGPLLVLHGRQDPIAPFAHGEALAAAVTGAEFLAMACGHNDRERPWPAVLSFLQRHQLLDSLPPN